LENASVGAICQFGIPQLVPIDGEISYEEIADSAGVDLDQIRRHIRHAMTRRIFKEPREGFVAHTAISRVLVDDPPLKDWVDMFSDDFFPGGANVVRAMQKYPGSQESSETAYALAHGGLPLFADLASDPARLGRFGRAMGSLSSGEGHNSKVLCNYPLWSKLGKATIVDVSGSTSLLVLFSHLT
jgi:hypothetical protein